MENTQELCSAHSEPIIMYCLAKECNTQKLCSECIRSHDFHLKNLYSLKELSKLVNELFLKDHKLDQLRVITKRKDDFIAQKTPEIVNSLKETFNNFIKNVKNTINETGKTEFGTLSVLNQDERLKQKPDELIKTYHALEALSKNGIASNIEIDLKVWEEESFKIIQQISKDLQEKLTKFSLKKDVIACGLSDSQILKNSEDKHNFCEIIKENLDFKINNFSLIYRATINGDTKEQLKKETGEKIPLIFLIKVKETGLIYGVFTSVKYALNDNDYYQDNKAFIFSVSKKKAFKVKVPQNAGYDAYFLGFGGGGDLNIQNGCLTSNKSYNNFGIHYDNYNGNNWSDIENKTYLAGIEKYTVEDVECFHLT